ncbi:hypothetical protein [Burkholderia glumae]|uniref:Uncharacterized protein n=1 Tax=Burkholderia glumae TaxID=337 RepID=A0AAQ0BUM7_BURGL|nr:hypothetical protein [Burkholderia glumae]MCM2483024.1 hypothetical protein [Burkholderia glumae]MCM2493526.1 hypothetical protein [Burkholderia glumae]MCM2506340.1 hypothetical protein [Burkholderia glumae]MCM2537926.1 hypothetical protein [Burkholderia glumae]MCM2543852.1 hypothetical protein [Burkholderia glumae]
MAERRAGEAPRRFKRADSNGRMSQTARTLGRLAGLVCLFFFRKMRRFHAFSGFHRMSAGWSAQHSVVSMPSEQNIGAWEISRYF